MSHKDLMVAIILFFACCEKDAKNLSGGVPIIEPNGSEAYLKKNSDFIFDQNSLHTFKINLPEEALDFIDSDPAAEEYVNASLTFNGETISPIGIRYKGSVGAFVGSVSGDDWTNPSGHKIATKISMKVKIDWKGRNNTFYGLKKLQFHSQNLDPTQMHERLGYWLFREMGVIAPRSVHAKLFINGTYYGLYALTEQIDDKFIDYNFSDNSGNLYKEVWPLKSNGKVNTCCNFISALRTNTSSSTSCEIIRSFAQEIIDADRSSIKSVISHRMDVNHIISYAVVDRLIKNDDGAFHWYCDGNSCSNHNYYWYEEASTRKLYLIPWDLDDAFKNINYQSPVTHIANRWGEISNDCKPFPFGDWGIYQKSASCDALTQGWTYFTEEFENTKIDFMAGPFSESQVIQQLDTWVEQITDATIEAEHLHSDAVSEEEWMEAIQSLKDKLTYARNNY